MHSVLDTYIEVPTGHSKWRYSSTWINECETENIVRLERMIVSH